MPFANPTKENDALVAWDGTNAFPRDTTSGSSFGYVFEVETTLTADAVFAFEAYDSLAANPCMPDMGTAVPETDKPLCYMIGAPIPMAEPAVLAIPNGTPAGAKIGVNLRCYAKQFSGLVSVSGPTASVKACVVVLGIRQGR